MKAAMQILKKNMFWRHPVLQYNTDSPYMLRGQQQA